METLKRTPFRVVLDDLIPVLAAAGFLAVLLVWAVLGFLAG